MKKINALANFLECEVEELEVTRYDDDVFEYDGSEYLVLTDDEADERAKEYILDSVWAFNSNFIIEHSKALDYDKASEQIVKAIQEKCEDGNEAILRLIDNKEEFVDDAISSDGRGHFLSSYDGEENEEGEYYIYRTN